MKMKMKNEKINSTLIFFLIALLISSNMTAQQSKQTIINAKPGTTKPAKSQIKVPTTRILFVFDASYSMIGKWEKELKIDVAKKTLLSIIDTLQRIPNIQMALRVYGHQSPVPPQDCNDTRLEVPFSANNVPMIRQKLKKLEPKGTTPIAHSLELCVKDFPPCDNCRNIIILITDGMEECGGDPCAVSMKLQSMGITLKPFIIGINIDEEFRKTFECVGTYYDALSEQKFKELMGIVITQVLNSTTAQVNLLDSQGLPTETNVNMTFYDRTSGKVKYNYIHTLNNRGNPDTIILDPLITYRVVINTIPPVYIDSVKLVSGKHNIIATDAPQGMLIIKSSSIQYKDVLFQIRQSKQATTLNYQKLDETEKYIVGKYDVEIPVLPIINIHDIDIRQSYTTTIEIPKPGIANFLTSSPGYGSLYVMRNGKQDWIYNLIGGSGKSESVILQPGSYVIVFRALNAKQTLYSMTKYFDITQGSTVAITLN